MSEEKTRGRALARGLASLYLVSLVLLILTMRLVGEHWWLTTLLIYLPRIGWALPWPFVVGLCVVVGERRRALVVGAVTAFLLVFPLMGLQLSGRHEAAAGSIRVMSWNTYFGRVDNEAIHRKILEEKPDIFLGQASAHRTKDLFRADPAGYEVQIDEEFMLLSRFPVVDKLVAADLPEDSHHRGNFVRYTLKTPKGLIDVYNIHPRSPRGGVERLRGLGLRTRLMGGDVPQDGAAPVEQNSLLRWRQVEMVATEVQRSKNPVLVAGDTNLPTLSALFHHAFSQLQDGFSVAGQGLGYTFPAKRPWLRIDRILAGDRFRFLDFQTGRIVASDHHYVVADLVLAE